MIILKLEKKSPYVPLHTDPLLLLIFTLITARKRSLGQGNVFTPVCHSDHRGIGFPACITGHMTRGISTKGGLPRGDLYPRGWADPPPLRDTWNTTGYGQQEGGMHPSGIFVNKLKQHIYLLLLI